MIKLVVIEQFSLGNNPKYKFDDIKKTIVRKSIEKNEDGVLYVGDTFESDESMAKYLLNEIKNPEDRPFVEKTEVEPEKYNMVNGNGEIIEAGLLKEDIVKKEITEDPKAGSVKIKAVKVKTNTNKSTTTRKRTTKKKEDK